MSQVLKANQIQFADIFDINEIQRMQDLLSDATGVASIIIASDGTPVTKPSNFCRLYNDFVLKTDKGRENCFQSQNFRFPEGSSASVIQPYLIGGLWNSGARITVGGIHIGNWLIVRSAVNNPMNCTLCSMPMK